METLLTHNYKGEEIRKIKYFTTYYNYVARCNKRKKVIRYQVRRAEFDRLSEAKEFIDEHLVENN